MIKIEDANDAVPLAKALCEGGLPCAEVTFRTEAAEAAIQAMREAYPDMLLIAGTVLTKEQADRQCQPERRQWSARALTER